MLIDRVAVKQIIASIPKELRTAARNERKFIIKETKKDPIGTSYRAAYGRYEFSNNIKLSETIRELNKKMAADLYSLHKASASMHRKPWSMLIKDDIPQVVKASSYLE